MIDYNYINNPYKIIISTFKKFVTIKFSIGLIIFIVPSIFIFSFYIQPVGYIFTFSARLSASLVWLALTPFDPIPAHKTTYATALGSVAACNIRDSINTSNINLTIYYNWMGKRLPASENVYICRQNALKNILRDTNWLPLQLLYF